ncbi:hypothetical protein CUMW_233890 [Citrus unshiu]|uniref:Uncharacterized protein n=1 Tax=Citrus unshiu TaxID=55188 RepID=A0A2H5QIM1_CITUN|nr:hypothetical protein CUMW_233890 [Citrus unshiu]
MLEIISCNFAGKVPDSLGNLLQLNYLTGEILGSVFGDDVGEFVESSGAGWGEVSFHFVVDDFPVKEIRRFNVGKEDE